MKGFITGFLVALYALPAVSAGGVSRIIPGTDKTTAESVGRTESSDSGRGGTVATRTSGTSRISSDTSNNDAPASRTAVTRIVRAISPTTTDSTPTSTRTATTQTRTSNRATSVARSLESSDTARDKLEAAVRTVGRSSRTEAASINSNPAVRRMGLTLRPSTAEVGGRAILASGEQTGSNIESEIRNLQSRIAVGKKKEEQKLDPVAIAEAKDRLEQTAALNKSCQEQYNDCMDQFCAVIDANQKRCSCSANLSKYAKVEQAVKDANAQLNEVAQNIRYVGLSADEISAIMSATEAEEAMTGATDTTENRSLLADIEKMIKDPTVSTSSSSMTTDSYGLIDIDLDFSTDGTADLFSLDFLSGGNSSFSNLRGADLYNAAKKRCNTVISQCKEVGATAQQITGNYDLAIDKDCIAYEVGLNKMNDTLVSNVRSATRMLQKARLAVLQNQNSYDARGCVSALEKCMTDDMVCGEDYTKCLDPTKMYIDENGNVVLGKNINMIQNFMTDYNNAGIDASFLSSAYGTSISDSCGSDGKCIVKYLISKIGTKQKATDEGLCRPVLDKCRAYTYNNNGNYMPYNDIVINYIQRAMVNIKAAQYQIVANYASTCLSDIATCYNDQVSQLTSWSATAAASSVYNIMRGACRNVALTCGYAVFSADSASCPANNQDKCIESISEIFYQSLLCPDNSIYMMSHSNTISVNNTYAGWVNTMCKCKDDFVTFNGACLPLCDNGGQYLASGVCGSAQVCDAGKWYYKNQCRSCPAHSTEMENGVGGNVLGGHCMCDDGGTSNPYLPSPNGLSCRRCPSNSQYNSERGTCVCENENYTYNETYNCCGTGTGISGCVVQHDVGQQEQSTAQVALDR